MLSLVHYKGPPHERKSTLPPHASSPKRQYKHTTRHVFPKQESMDSQGSFVLAAAASIATTLDNVHSFCPERRPPPGSPHHRDRLCAQLWNTTSYNDKSRHAGYGTQTSLKTKLGTDRVELGLRWSNYIRVACFGPVLRL